MSAVSTDDIARDWARRLEAKEASRLGISLAAARRRVADRIGIAAGTLENLSRQRIKGVREAVYARLRAAVIRELQHEIAAHAHELTVLMADDRRRGSRAVAEVEAGLVRLRSLLTDSDSSICGPNDGARP